MKTFRSKTSTLKFVLAFSVLMTSSACDAQDKESVEKVDSGAEAEISIAQVCQNLSDDDGQKYDYIKGFVVQSYVVKPNVDCVDDCADFFKDIKSHLFVTLEMDGEDKPIRVRAVTPDEPILDLQNKPKYLIENTHYEFCANKKKYEDAGAQAAFGNWYHIDLSTLRKLD